ncbi:MAG: hypothetical protein KatS3mg068_0118 [Candidatus Sericytochromatia bacterium]|nr:MAG: hypothetical protein KatS3mg068_0118 [Candidatus Sericytochromatia bacterium]
MLKKTISIVVSLFAVASLNACGTSSNLLIEDSLINANEQQAVNASSFSGVWKEITKSSEASFKALDKNKDKNITPDEFGVSSPESFTAFNKLDSNNDGKISKNEYLPNLLEKTTLTLRLKNAARDLFKLLDKNKDNGISLEELNSGLISSQFATLFQKYDKQGKNIFGKSNKGKLTKSEFENLYAHIAMSNTSNSTQPAPAPADPSQPAPAPAK